MDNKPIINMRDRNISVSIFKKEGKDAQGKSETYYSACLQRSYKKKDGDDWQRETINLYPDDLPKLSNLAQAGYNALLKYTNAQKQAKSEQPAKPFTPSQYQAAKNGDLTPPSWTTEEVPFDM